MKKVNYLFVLSAILLSTVSFAYVPNKTTCHTPIFCPQKIICSQGGKITSCKPLGANAEYWNLEGMNQGGRIAKAEYIFNSANSAYQPVSSDNGNASCNYQYSANGVTKTLQLVGKRAAYLEPSLDNSKSWSVYAYSANCSQPGTTASCPFIEPGLFINKMAKISPSNSAYLKIKLSVDGNVIKNDDTSPANEQSMLVTYDEAFPACGGAKQCKIDISIDPENSAKPTYPLVVGSVLVDMTHDMKVLSFNPNLCTGYAIKQVESFNAVMIEKTKPIACSH